MMRGRRNGLMTLPVSEPPATDGQYLLGIHHGDYSVYRIVSYRQERGGWQIGLAGNWYWQPFPAPPQE